MFLLVPVVVVVLKQWLFLEKQSSYVILKLSVSQSDTQPVSQSFKEINFTLLEQLKPAACKFHDSKSLTVHFLHVL